MPETTEVLFRRFGPGYRWLVMLTAMSTTISAVLAATIVNVAIPDIMGAFGVGQDRAQWLSTGFLAAAPVTMLLNDWAVRTFGMRNTYIAPGETSLEQMIASIDDVVERLDGDDDSETN